MSAFDRLTWKADRMLLDELVFRLQHARSDAGELGDDCFVFYKVKPLVDQYARFFARLEDFRPRNVLELGIFEGGSIAFWFELFSPVKHVAVDIGRPQRLPYLERYLDARRLRDRVAMRWETDQADRRKLAEIVEREFEGPLDLVIDDALHLYPHTKASFEALFPRLRVGGYYVIEDWAWDHWKEVHSPTHGLYSQPIPLTRLIFDLIEATGSSQTLISQVTVSEGFAVVQRGPETAISLDDFALDRRILRRPKMSVAFRLRARACRAGSTSPPPATLRRPALRMQTKLIAFYLPQFHTIPENDGWWGKGFTEWRSVTRATPRFRGHYQPHLPSELGYYDLRLPETREAQAALARDHGVHGFCYYHYWFEGRRVLERPFEEVLATGRPDFPFCLCWANENWTRAWDGLQHEMLRRQTYSAEDDVEHLRSLARAFRDRRYIRIDGKPLFLVYRTRSIPDVAGMLARWREAARRLDVGELYLCRVESGDDGQGDPRPMGFDAAVEFQPKRESAGAPLRDSRLRRLMRRARLAAPASCTLYDYETLVERAIAEPMPPYPRFPCVSPSWDNSPRRAEAANVFINSSPEGYRRWVLAAAHKTRSAFPREPVMFVNAWNEWGEGAHLEPCQRWGRAFLEATRNALELASRTS